MKLRHVARPRSRGQVLIILLGALWLGGAASMVGGVLLTGMGTDEIDEALESKVADPARRTAARAVLERWEKDAARFVEEIAKESAAMEKLFKAQDAERAAIEERTRRVDALADEAVRKVLDHRFELRELLTAAEWTDTFGSQLDR
jgi:hypothetical protein